MTYLAHVQDLPSADHLSEYERKLLDKRFDANDYEVNIEGDAIEWGLIDEVEVAKAARQNNPAGWFVRNLLYGGDRYHVGIYFGKQEMVLTNITLEMARYVLQTIAYYVKQDVRYTGVEEVAPLAGDGA